MKIACLRSKHFRDYRVLQYIAPRYGGNKLQLIFCFQYLVD